MLFRSNLDLLEERVRHLDENACAVAGVGLTAAGATVIEIAQHLDGLLQDAVGLAPLHVHDEADTTRLVFEPGVVQTLLLRLSGPTAWTSVALALHNEFPRARGSLLVPIQDVAGG